VGLAVIGYIYYIRRRWLLDLEEIRRTGESHINPEYFRNPFAARHTQVALPFQTVDGTTVDLSQPYCIAAKAQAHYVAEADRVHHVTDVRSYPQHESVVVTTTTSSDASSSTRAASESPSNNSNGNDNLELGLPTVDTQSIW
jgi:hypothetical protein